MTGKLTPAERTTCPPVRDQQYLEGGLEFSAYALDLAHTKLVWDQSKG